MIIKNKPVGIAAKKDSTHIKRHGPTTAYVKVKTYTAIHTTKIWNDHGRIRQRPAEATMRRIELAVTNNSRARGKNAEPPGGGKKRLKAPPRPTKNNHNDTNVIPSGRLVVTILSIRRSYHQTEKQLEQCLGA